MQTVKGGTKCLKKGDKILFVLKKGGTERKTEEKSQAGGDSQ